MMDLKTKTTDWLSVALSQSEITITISHPNYSMNHIGEKKS